MNVFSAFSNLPCLSFFLSIAVTHSTTAGLCLCTYVLYVEGTDGGMLMLLAVFFLAKHTCIKVKEVQIRVQEQVHRTRIRMNKYQQFWSGKPKLPLCCFLMNKGKN